MSAPPPREIGWPALPAVRALLKRERGWDIVANGCSTIDIKIYNTGSSNFLTITAAVCSVSNNCVALNEIFEGLKK